jgi:UDP-glucose 4-epimerase
MTSAALHGQTAMVTGVNGTIGSAMAEAFVACGARVIGTLRSPVCAVEHPDVEPVVCDLSTDALIALIVRVKPDIIFHAAGSASVSYSFSAPDRDFAASVDLFQRVLEAVRLSGIRPRIVFPSSAAVYGDPEHIPVRESARFYPLSPYGFHKVMAEMLAREYARCFDIPVLVVRLFSIFGARQRRLLVWELFRQFRDEPAVTLRGSGSEVRDYLAVEDMGRAIAALLPSLREGFSTVNVASGHGTTVRDLAEMLGRLLGSTKEVLYLNQPSMGDPHCWVADTTELEALGQDWIIQAARNLEPALARTLATWRGGDAANLARL